MPIGFLYESIYAQPNPFDPISCSIVCELISNIHAAGFCPSFILGTPGIACDEAILIFCYPSCK